ncbi:hypothetical protein DV096_14480 [Bradymonadaceae bacterium TMQ3]|nr:hypothetical protein DV096_14480 [Bradymonadaceae bacterium TMQ3]TXC74874.1 hypothetical protein FRC91_15085 [Bradymonadales bacterium TMQ1]
MVSRRHRKRSSIAAAFTLALSVLGCTEPNPAYQGDPLLPEDCRAGIERSELFDRFERPELLDVLVVMDNAGEMQAYQRALAEAMPGFLERLEGEGRLDVQVGVVTTDARDGAGLAPIVRDVEGCESNTLQVAYSGTEGWVRAAACNVQQGEGGDGFQQALDVIETNVLGQASALRAFRREEARLLILVVSNEDDCSGATPGGEGASRDVCAWNAEDRREIAPLVEELLASAESPEGISFAVISGPPSGVSYEDGEVVRSVCRSTLGAAYPGNRLYQTVEAFGERGVFTSACTLDFFDQLDRIADRLALTGSVTLCASEPMAHEPLEVLGLTDEGQEKVIGFGSGFVFLGPVEGCDNGALSLKRRGLEGIVEVSTRYCALP